MCLPSSTSYLSIIVCPVPPEMSREEDTCSDSETDASDGDVDDFVSDVIRRDGNDEPPDGSWTFQARSTRGAKMYQGLSERIVKDKFRLLFNPVDSYLLEKSKKEVAHLLSQGRLKLHHLHC